MLYLIALMLWLRLLQGNLFWGEVIVENDCM